MSKHIENCLCILFLCKEANLGAIYTERILVKIENDFLRNVQYNRKNNIGIAGGLDNGYF